MDHNENKEKIQKEKLKNDMISRIGDFHLDDPFEDPSLCTTAFMDILWQDEHGNSALMLASAENRVQQVKGILHMAINSGKLWQVIDMRNKEHLNCVDMAIRAGSETCAILITKVVREYAKHRPRSEHEKSRDSMVITEEDVTFTLAGGGSKGGDQFDDNYIRELVRQSSTSSGHANASKKLSREKISNSLLTKSTTASAGKDYMRMVKRSSSAHSRLMSQRTFSVESGSMDSSEPTTPKMTTPPADHGVLSSVGERIRNIFGKKPPLHTKSLSIVQTDRVSSPAARSSSVSSKPLSYASSGVGEEDHLKLPQHTSSSPETPPIESAPPAPAPAGLFRWGSRDRAMANTVNTANGVRLPPLNLRRRASSDPKNREFTSLGDDE